MNKYELLTELHNIKNLGYFIPYYCEDYDEYELKYILNCLKYRYNLR